MFTPAAIARWPWEWQYPLTEGPAGGAVLLLVVLVGMSPVTLGIVVGKWWLKRRTMRLNREESGIRKSRGLGLPSSAHGTRPWMVGPVVAVWLVIFVEAAFLAYLWGVQVRFCLMFVPLLAAVGCTAASRFIEWPIEGLAWCLKGLARWIWGARESGGRVLEMMRTMCQAGRLWHAAVTLILAGVVLVMHHAVEEKIDGMIRREVSAGGYPFSDQREYPRMGAWVKEHLPDAVIMCRNPWELIYYCGPKNRGVGSPNPRLGGKVGAEQILAIAKYYGVTHIYADQVRGPLVPYFNASAGAFKRVPGAPGMLFEIDWSKVQVRSVEEVFGGGGK
jgi:hypothetical protein